jgi:recombination protein RecA
VSAEEKVLKTALEEIRKKFGQDAILRLGDDSDYLKVDVISTGSLTLDAATIIGGYPRGRICEISGPEASGKTTLALHAIAECQAAGGRVAVIDAEHALDPVYAKAIGVDVDDLYISQPMSGEQGLEIAESIVRSGAFDMVVVDSVGALVTEAEISGLMGDSHVAGLARLMSQGLRKLSSLSIR